MEKSTKCIKAMFLNFFKKENHKVLKSSSIIPKNDSSLLFANAGMNQFKDFYLNIEKPSYKNISTSQYCLRIGGKHNDLNIVGYTNRHHTLFEMLGNFSFGGYFKYESIMLAWKLLTSESWFNIHKSKLLVTVYYLDRESYDIWTKAIGIPKEKVIIIGDKNKNKPFVSDNFWCMGETGPCGPCSEVFYDYGEHLFGCLPGDEKGCGNRYVEVWNLVFMQFNRQANNLMIPLANPSVDTGVGLERVSAVLQNVDSTFKTDIFSKTISILKKELNISYLNDYLYVIADHIRTCFYIIKSGIYPSNEGRGYALRRIIRRMIRHLNLLGIEKICLYKLIYELKDIFIDYFEEDNINIKHIENVILYEEARFYNTIKKGLDVFISKVKKKEVKGELDGKDAFVLYDTYGLPFDFILEICNEKDIKIDKDSFKVPLELQKKTSRKYSSFIRSSEVIYLKPTCIFVGYRNLEYIGFIKEICINNIKVSTIYEGQYGELILTKTAFYPETGEQAGDIGELKAIKGLFKVINTKSYNKTILHIGRAMYGNINLKEAVIITVDAVKRSCIKANHSVVHILNKVLCRFFKKKPIQKASYIGSNYLRLEFICGKLLNNEEANIIEEEVNEQIIANISPDIGLFYLTSQAFITKNNIRIEAITGREAICFVFKSKTILKNLKEATNRNEYKLCEYLIYLKSEYNKLEREVIYIRNKQLSLYSFNLIKESINYKDIIIIKTIGSFYSSFMGLITKVLIDRLRTKVIILVTKQDNNARFVFGVASDLLFSIKAKDIIGYIIKNLKGKGGGSLSLVQGLCEFILFKKEIQAVSSIILKNLKEATIEPKVVSI